MRRIVLVSVVALVLAGCGPKRARTGAVSGKLTYKTQPVNNAALLLYSVSKEKADPILIPVEGDGSFRITDVPPGEYKVVVQGSSGASEASPRSLKNVPKEKQAEMMAKLEKMKTPATIDFPNKYKSREKTDLKCTVTDSNQTVNLELKD